MAIVVACDLTAAIGFTHRTGNARMRHVRINDIWNQEAVREVVYQ